MASKKEWIRRFHAIAVLWGISAGVFSLVFLAGFGALEQWQFAPLVPLAIGFAVYKARWNKDRRLFK